MTNPLKWAWKHFGWGWHGHALDKLHHTRYNGNRQYIKAVCAQSGNSRKSVKKQDRRARMQASEIVKMRTAAREAFKQNRQPVFRQIGEAKQR